MASLPLVQNNMSVISLPTYNQRSRFSGALSGYIPKSTDDGFETGESAPVVMMYRAIPLGSHYVVDWNSMLVPPDLWPLCGWTL